MKENAAELSKTFSEAFAPISDPRIDRRKLYLLEEILLLVLTATIAGCKSWREIEQFGRLQSEMLRLFYPFSNGFPSDDTIRLIIERLSPKQFQKCFSNWVHSMELPDTLVLAIDGKTARRTKTNSGSPLHMVTAFASEYNLILGQEKVADKSNEIKAIPELLKVLDFSGKNVVITMDAIGCQREIVDIIVAKEADYCICVKANQERLLEAVRAEFQNHQTKSEHKTVEKNRGRIEERVCSVINVSDDFKQKHNAWAGLSSVIKISTTRCYKEKIAKETRYYISSLSTDALTALHIIRSHWTIENQLHWILDMTFRDDESRLKKGNAPENMTIVKHFAINLLKMSQTKGEAISRLSKGAGWSQNQMLRILSHLKQF